MIWQHASGVEVDARSPRRSGPRHRRTERLTSAQTPGESADGAEGAVAGADDEIGVGGQRGIAVNWGAQVDLE